MSKLPVRSARGEDRGEYELSDALLVFDKGLQPLHDAVVAYQANQRSGTANTKTKSEVAGTKAKPWRQKGSGRARAGYQQSPIWRGGGIAFGPKPRSYAKRQNKKAARLAFRRAFSEKVAAGQVTVVEDLALEQPKTKLFAGFLAGLGLSKALVLVEAADRNLLLSARNVPGVEVVRACDVNVYQLLRYPAVLVTRAAMDGIERRLQAPAKRGA